MREFRLVYPMFAMVVLTSVVLARLFLSRVAAVRAGKVSFAFFRIYQGEVEPEETAKLSRHFVNLFEAPTLFYVACLTAMVTHDDAIDALALAWLYVAARLNHTRIHLGPNRLRHRIQAYFASWIVLALLWLDVVVRAAIKT